MHYLEIVFYMMPPPHIGDNNKNRVENIKKKFEDINKFVPVSDNLYNSRSNVGLKSRSDRSEDVQNTYSRHQGDSPKKQKLASDKYDSSELNSNNQTSSKNNSGGHPVLERQLSSPTSRAHIKRSPAFRCDRIVRGKNILTPTPSDRTRSVVDKRVKQFDTSSTPDFVAAKLCNAVIGDEQSVHNNIISPVDNVNERARAFTSPSDNFSRSSHTPLSNGSGAPIDTKRNRLEISRQSGAAVNKKSSSSASWLHSDQEREINGSRSDSLNDGSRGQHIISIQENAPVKNLLLELKSKKLVKDFSTSNPICVQRNKKSVESPVSQTNSALKDWPLSPSVNPHNCDNQTYQPGLSATLKAALKAPLPCGPPPKKPPRTFAHSSPVPKSSVNRISNVKCITSAIKKSIDSPFHTSVSPPPIVKPVRSKTESQIMLRKIEDALLNHKASVRSPMSPINNGLRQGSLSPSCSFLTTSGHSLSPSDSQNKIVTPTHAARSGCLSSLNCAMGPTMCSQQSRDSCYEVKNKQPEFTPDPAMKRKSSLQDTTSPRKNVQGTLHKSHSVEHIYAEPFQFIGDGSQICKSKDCEANFRISSFGREITKQPRFPTKRILSTSPEQIFRARLASSTDTNSEGLHYLVKNILS